MIKILRWNNLIFEINNIMIIGKFFFLVYVENYLKKCWVNYLKGDNFLILMFVFLFVFVSKDFMFFC